MHTVCVCEQHQNAKLLVAAFPEQLDNNNILSELVFNLNEKNCMLHSCNQCPRRPQLQKALEKILYNNRCHHRLKVIHSRSDTSRTGVEGLSFYYPRLLHCLNQILAVVLLSQHQVSSSKTVRPCAPC